MKTATFPIEIGMTVYLEPTGNAARRTDKANLLPGTVSEIGEKCFCVESDRLRACYPAKFDKDTFECENDGKNYGYKIYATREDYEREQTRLNLLREITCSVFKYFYELPADVVGAMYEPLANWLRSTRTKTNNGKKSGCKRR